ncbi:nucleotidyltransferase family protein [Glaciihabitans sp. INWT7]|uniref:nucleotidyltransferase family protein n=1 Tax=Glaciihabitans sp. INWT7 TaxID=2596912 RepID=UPI00162791F0|nr:nucleotidyltransferase family protein [Glaciihabitans sp. INWT7]QNE46074.1 nucleotidyltransferase family protein [Glaciihabitans sp. INWT7]
MTTLTGIVLAAGGGTRLGRPKALLRTADGEPWVARAAGLLHAAGCDRVVVVLGAAAEEAEGLVPAGCEILIAQNWAEGMGESLRVGLGAASGDAALITLVDLPELPVAVVNRTLERPVTRHTLRQAAFDGRPGHPVLIGNAHWAAVASTLVGDRGARDYLVAHDVQQVECGDLFDGHDVDRL